MANPEIFAPEAARLLGVRIDEVYRLCVSGKVRARKVKIGSLRRAVWKINLVDITERAAKLEERAAKREANGRA